MLLAWRRLLQHFSQLIVGFVLVGSLYLCPQPAQAQAALDLAITPPTTYLNLKPGETQTHTILVKNAGSEALVARLSLVDFQPDGDTGQPVLGDTSTFSYLQFTDPSLAWDTDFHLPAQSEKKIILSLAVPADAAVGEYPLTILLSGSRVSANVAGQAQITGTIGSNLVVLISHQDQDQGLLEVLPIETPRIIDSLQPLAFGLRFKNTGRNATPIQGTVSVVNAFNKPVKRYLLYPDMVLASSTRQARAYDITTTPISDITALLQQPEIIPLSRLAVESWLLLGSYTIFVDTPHGQVSQTITALPISLLLVGLTIPLLIMTAVKLSQYFSKRWDLN